LTSAEGDAMCDFVLLLHPAGLVAALISCGIPALLRGLTASYAQQALQVLTSGAGKDLGLNHKLILWGLGFTNGTQICETPGFRAAVQKASTAVRKGSVVVDFQDFLQTFR
jgi:hypothetical protein